MERTFRTLRGFLPVLLLWVMTLPVAGVAAGNVGTKHSDDSVLLPADYRAESHTDYYGIVDDGYTGAFAEGHSDGWPTGYSGAQADISRWRTEVYEAFISGKMERWKSVLDALEKETWSRPDALAEVIGFHYGYVAWCLGNDRKREAEGYLTQLEKNLERWKELGGESAGYHAFRAAAYGFRIGLSLWRAPFLGPKSMDQAEQALEADADNFRANVEMGNIWNHMPAVFGGSDEKALRYYLRAVEIIEAQPEEVRSENWYYLNLLVTTGQMHQQMGQLAEAESCYRKALDAEPRFGWVRDELLPSVRKR